MEYAGLINKKQAGPDMPLDARYLVRLPLIVLRRVIPEPSPWQYALNALEEFAPPLEGYKWVLVEELPCNQGRFVMTGVKVETVEGCDDCDGDGYFWHGNHEYECKECDGEGKHYHKEIDNISQAIVTIDGRIIESPTVH